MTMSGGRNSAVWMGGSVALIVLSIIVARALVTGGEGDTPSFTVRDSAGAEIVENFRPVWGEGAGWQVGSQPILRLGVVDGDPHLQFNFVTGAARLPDGTVVVADFGSQEVRFFDPSGAWAATAGREGGGPGEFTGLSGLGLSPDGRVWAYDFSLRRITWLDSSGEIVGITSLDPVPPTLNPVGALPDGTFALKQLWGATAVAEASEQGLRRDPVAYVRFDTEGTLVDTLGLFPGRELFLWDEDGRGAMGTPPFGRNSVSALYHGGVAIGSQETFELESFAPGGELTRVVRLPTPDLSLGPEDLEELIQERMETTPPDRHASLRDQMEAMAMPPTRPAYGALVGDDPGNLWVGEWAMLPSVPDRWTVIDTLGRWLGPVDLPPRFSPLHIGDDWILGVELDDLDVEYLVVYPLEKPEGPGD